ncbi:MAG: hypothetical protein H6737_23155 [Alphaproteobacteria bacterium]|nr:hypothetical protein [Alphaproteobacteria bacterium]
MSIARLSWVAVLAACVPETLLDADPARDGAAGALGPHQVVLEHRSASARVEERVAYDWIRPDPLPDDAPVVLFVHGGFVDRERYRWLGQHVASRGYGFASPEHALDLAIAESGNLRFVLDDVERREGRRPTASAGHSLGGVIAEWGWEDDTRIGSLALLASFPAGSGRIGPGGEVLSLSGASDGSALPDDVREGAARFVDARLAFVDGMNHYAWTDDATERELANDGPLGRPLPEVRTDALRVLDTWLDAVLQDDLDARARLDEPFPGVSP